MYTTDDNHGAQTQFHSGRHMLDGEFPTLGAWVHYGLGSLNDNLPQFVSMGRREYWNARDGHYLGPAHDAVPLRIDPANPLDYGQPEGDVGAEEQRVGFDLVGRLNRLRAVEYPDDPALAARIQAYELAFRMQTSLPEVLELQRRDGGDEGDSTAWTTRRPATSACRCWRRGGWSSAACASSRSSTAPAAPASGTPTAACGPTTRATVRQVDQPIAGLLKDLKRRGLLDETIVVFATEFGRTPGTQGSDGRDHHIYGFSVWLAGGGIKGGVVHGATDEIGFHAVEDRHYVTDIHATILHLLGLDSRRLEIPGRKRLEIDHGRPIEAIMA